MLQDAVEDAGPVKPGCDRGPAGDGGGPEPADLLHPPDVQLQMRPPRGQRVQAALGAPGQVAAQIRFGVLTGRALEAGQVGSRCQSQPVGERRQRPVVSSTWPADSSPGEIYPSEIEVPAPGCWQFTLSWNGHTDTIDLWYVRHR
jgi:hypothetical protein